MFSATGVSHANGTILIAATLAPTLCILKADVFGYVHWVKSMVKSTIDYAHQTESYLCLVSDIGVGSRVTLIRKHDGEIENTQSVSVLIRGSRIENEVLIAGGATSTGKGVIVLVQIPSLDFQNITEQPIATILSVAVEKPVNILWVTTSNNDLHQISLDSLKYKQRMSIDDLESSFVRNDEHNGNVVLISRVNRPVRLLNVEVEPLQRSSAFVAVITSSNCNCNNCTISSCGGNFAFEQQACSKRGICPLLNKCQCEDGYDGKTCEFMRCPQLPILGECSGKGKCFVPTKCTCTEGYEGEICEKLKGCPCGKCVYNNVCFCELLDKGGSNCKQNQTYTSDTCPSDQYVNNFGGVRLLHAITTPFKQVMAFGASNVFIGIHEKPYFEATVFHVANGTMQFMFAVARQDIQLNAIKQIIPAIEHNTLAIGIGVNTGIVVLNDTGVVFEQPGFEMTDKGKLTVSGTTQPSLRIPSCNFQDFSVRHALVADIAGNSLENCLTHNPSYIITNIFATTRHNESIFAIGSGDTSVMFSDVLIQRVGTGRRRFILKLTHWVVDIDSKECEFLTRLVVDNYGHSIVLCRDNRRSYMAIWKLHANGFKSWNILITNATYPEISNSLTTMSPVIQIEPTSASWIYVLIEVKYNSMVIIKSNATLLHCLAGHAVLRIHAIFGELNSYTCVSNTYKQIFVSNTGVYLLENSTSINLAVFKHFECLLCNPGSEPNGIQNGCALCSGNTWSNGTKCEYCPSGWISVNKDSCTPLFYILLGNFVGIVGIAVISMVLLVICTKQFCCKQKARKEDPLLALFEIPDASESTAFSVAVDITSVKFEDISEKTELPTGGSGTILVKGKWKSIWVVIKFFNLNEQSIADFYNELSILIKMRDKNIVYFYGSCNLKSKVGIVMEYCSKGNLRQYMYYNKGNISYSKKLQILIQIASGLKYIHSMEIIHRDMKLDNILIDELDNVKLTDFGIAKSTVSSHQHTNKIGTSYYMAPEVTLGNEYDYKCDIFSFSMIMYEVLTEVIDLFKKLAFNIEVKIALEDSFRPQVPMEFMEQAQYHGYIAIMTSCWQKDASLRPSSEELFTKLVELREIVDAK